MASAMVFGRHDFSGPLSRKRKFCKSDWVWFQPFCHAACTWAWYESENLAKIGTSQKILVRVWKISSDSVKIGVTKFVNDSEKYDKIYQRKFAQCIWEPHKITFKLKQNLKVVIIGFPSFRNQYFAKPQNKKGPPSERTLRRSASPNVSKCSLIATK